ncbi:hypothetical protein CsatA_012375 [Cannabis sativa]
MTDTEFPKSYRSGSKSSSHFVEGSLSRGSQSPPVASGVASAASTSKGTSSQTRAQQASLEKKAQTKRNHDRPIPVAKNLKLNTLSASSSDDEEEDPMEVSFEEFDPEPRLFHLKK